MSTADQIKKIHQETGFSKHEASLKSHPNLWSQILSSRRRATRDATQLGSYKELLQKLIAATKNKNAAMSDEDIDAACLQYSNHFDKQYESILDRINSRYPNCFYEWSERHLSNEYAHWKHCLSALCETEAPTLRMFDELRAALDTLVEKFKNYYPAD